MGARKTETPDHGARGTEPVMNAQPSESTVEVADRASPDLAPPPLHPRAADVPTSVWTALWVILAFLVVSAGVLGS